MCIFSLTDWLILRNSTNINPLLIGFKNLVQTGFGSYTMPQQQDLFPNALRNGPSLSAKTLPFIVLDDLLNVTLKDLILYLNQQSIIVPLIFKSINGVKEQQLSFKLFAMIVLVILDAIGLLTATIANNAVTFELSETITVSTSTASTIPGDPPIVGTTQLQILEDTYTIKQLFMIMSSVLEIDVPFPILLFDPLHESNTIIQVTDSYKCYKILLVDSVLSDLFTEIFSDTFNSVTYNTYYRYSQCNQLSLELENSTTKCMPHSKMVPILAQITNAFTTDDQQNLVVNKMNIIIIGQDDESCNC
jgi:hypothetical protein